MMFPAAIAPDAGTTNPGWVLGIMPRVLIVEPVPDTGKKGRATVRFTVPQFRVFVDPDTISSQLSVKSLQSSIEVEYMANMLASRFLAANLDTEIYASETLSFSLEASVEMDPNIIKLKRNDHLRPVTFLLLEGGESANLAAATSVKLIYSKAGGGAIARTISTWTNDGRCSYAWTSQDTLNSGKYRYEIEVTFNSGRIQTYPEDGYGEFLVTDDLG